MTWALTMVLHISLSSFIALHSRRSTTGISKNAFYTLGLLTYAVIALTGWVLGFVGNAGVPPLPNTTGWLFIVIEGTAIPMAWLLHLWLIKYIGAANATVAGTLNYIAAALLAVAVLREAVTPLFLFAALMILGGVYMAALVGARQRQKQNISVLKSLYIALVAAGLFAVGILAEKLAIGTVGLWGYAAYGWTMQLLTMLVIFLLAGRHEKAGITRAILRQGIVLGVLSASAGALYIYALSIGTLNQTVIAASGKIAITALLAAIFLRERNALPMRLLACCLSVVGVYLLLS